MQIFKLSWAITPDDTTYVAPEEFTDGSMVSITGIVDGYPIKYGSTTWDIMVERLLMAGREAYQEQYEGIVPDWKRPAEDVLADKLHEITGNVNA